MAVDLKRTTFTSESQVKEHCEYLRKRLRRLFGSALPTHSNVCELMRMVDMAELNAIRDITLHGVHC